MTYELYNVCSLDVPIGSSGDCLDRLLLRTFEIKSSCGIIKECMLCSGYLNLNDIYYFDAQIEGLIFLFGNLLNSFSFGIATSSVEASKGEYSVCIGGMNS